MYADYEAFKQRLQDHTDIVYSMEVSAFPQWGTPNGGPGSVLLLYAPTITWTPFKDTAYGSGSFTFAFARRQYWTRTTTADNQTRLGLLTPPNGDVAAGNEFVQLTYTHTLPGDWNWLSVTVGQYEFDAFDNNQYADSTQDTFINLALAQNGTQAYATAGIGSYVQATSPDNQYSLAGGFQSATNIDGSTIATRGLSGEKYGYFIYGQWVPAFLPGATYSVIWYAQPSVPLQPAAAQGVSFSAVQNFGEKWGLFLRASHATGAVSPIETSIGWGAIYNDPFGHRKGDQLAAGFFWNKTNERVFDPSIRPAEWGMEYYYRYTVFKGLQITPDVQIYVNPAASEKRGPAAMFTLRTTAYF